MIRGMKRQECKILLTFKENSVAWERERDHVGAVREEAITGSGLGVCETSPNQALCRAVEFSG